MKLIKKLSAKIAIVAATTCVTFSCGNKSEGKTTASGNERKIDNAMLVEKLQLTFGFIKLTDMAPLAIDYRGYLLDFLNH